MSAKQISQTISRVRLLTIGTTSTARAAGLMIDDA
jgi:hypothetical protein